MGPNNTEPSAATTGELRSAQRLLNRKGRQISGKFLAEGRQSVREALSVPGLVQSVFVVNLEDHADLLNLSPQVITVTSAQMKRLSDTKTPPGIVAICQSRVTSLADIVKPQLVVICAQIRDPGNAGTVIRCADAFGADAVLLTEGSVELTNPKTIRSSVGSVFHLPIITGIGLDDALQWCRDQGLQIFATDSAGRPLTELKDALHRPTAWLMGNEAWGLPVGHTDLADQVVAIPMWGQAESLNLSTAAAICLYTTAAEQRTP